MDGQILCVHMKLFRALSTTFSTFLFIFLSKLILIALLLCRRHPTITVINDCSKRIIKTFYEVSVLYNKLKEVKGLLKIIFTFRYFTFH